MQFIAVVNDLYKVLTVQRTVYPSKMEAVVTLSQAGVRSLSSLDSVFESQFDWQCSDQRLLLYVFI